ncbi:MAG: bifunctional acetate--CoA ligase family protein/GNAT family N-acetyltransferase [Rhizobacter sp.]|nr:bifunctional acetate--CoA ligase family protein/GNAT family N-acetyltransferase [Rhizobacter sp.]
MSVRNLEHLFRPESVAVIGASERERSVGALVMRNLQQGGFAGPIWPVNPKHSQVNGVPAWPSVESLPQVPDLAVVCTPAATVPGIVEALGRKGTRAAIVLTAGLKAAARKGGATLEHAMLQAARPHLLRILGPNCLGLLVPGVGLNASFAQAAARPGTIAFVSQSGALATAMLDWANQRAIGFSHYISLGDSADVDFGDVLDYLASDAQTRSIMLYMESVGSARKFMSAARAAARNKPVVLVKAGRAPEGAKAAASHTGALAGGDDVFDAAVRRAGLVRVDSLGDLFDAAETLARAKALQGDRLAIVTNGGGAGVLAADALALGGGHLTPLGADTLQKLDAVLPPTWSKGNPVDIIGDAPVERYTAALQVLLDAPEVDAVLFMHAPTAIVPSADIAHACLPQLREANKSVLTCWLGGEMVQAAKEACAQAGVPTYETPERAAAAFLQMAAYRRNQEALLQSPPAAPPASEPDIDSARACIRKVLAEGRDLLTEPEAKALLQAFGIPVAATRTVASAAQAAEAAAEIGFPVVLKILSPQISHKSDVGGVALNLQSSDEVLRTAERMRERVGALRPDATLSGYTVQQMVSRPRAHELIVGVATDPVFGPAVLFGQGGTSVEVVRDRAVALPPLNMALAADLVSRTRVAGLLAGYRDRAAVDMEALKATLLKVSHMVCDLPELTELDINPLLADDQGVIALDARVKVREAAPGAADARLAIRPYPQHLEEPAEIEGRRLRMRPIRPEDGPRLQAFYAHATPGDMRLRFFLSRREVPRSELARYSQIDYDREMTFIAVPEDESDGMLGEVRAVCDPDNQSAEFAIQVATEAQGHGLGRQLMRKMLAYLRSHGTRVLMGECLVENTGMGSLARAMGFDVKASDDGDTLSMRLELD